MKLRVGTRRWRSGELNMASMIDVVFLLLIYFLFALTSGKGEQSMAMQLPRAGVGGESEAVDFDAVRVVIDGKGGKVSVLCDGVDVGGCDRLAERLKERRAIADVSVIIEGKNDVNFGAMVTALDVCYRADLRRVAFSAKTR